MGSVDEYTQKMIRIAALIHANKKKSNIIDWAIVAKLWNLESQEEEEYDEKKMKARFNQMRDILRRREKRKLAREAKAKEQEAKAQKRSSTRGPPSMDVTPNTNSTRRLLVTQGILCATDAASPMDATAHIPGLASNVASLTSEAMHLPVLATAVASATGTWALPSEIGLTPTTHDQIDTETPDICCLINDVIHGDSLDFYRAPLRVPVIDKWN